MLKKTVSAVMASALCLAVSASPVLQTAAFAAESGNSSQLSAVVTASSSSTVSTTLDQIDMSAWSYNSSSDVYYQTGITYCEDPANSSYEKLAVFVPGDYMTAVSNGDGTYTCTLDTSAQVGEYTAETAPIVFPVNTAGYSAQSALSGYSSSAAEYTSNGMIYVHAGCRGRESGAPAGVTDLKAAIRYIRYNSGVIPGDTDAIFSFGHSGGGAQSALLGATGDSELYDEYLEAIGAVEGVSDAVTGAMCWCPITNLDVADGAYEWNMGLSRGLTSGSGDEAVSAGLAASFAEYINELGLKDEDGNILTLEETSDGYYQAGSYYDYILEQIELSLNNYLEDNTSYGSSSSGSSGGPGGSGGPRKSSSASSSATYTSAEDYIDSLNDQAGTEWVTYDSSTGKASVMSVEGFSNAVKSASKGLGAFDDIDSKSQAENMLFGTGNSSYSHFNSVLMGLIQNNSTYSSYYDEFKSDLSQTDSLGNTIDERINMYNPMYYLCSYYDGYETSNAAQYWRIRSGIEQGDTAVNTEIDLALALENAGKDVDFAAVWEQGHTTAERTGDSGENFIEWVGECMEDLAENGSDSGDTGDDSGDTGNDSGNTGNDSGDTGNDSGNTGNDSRDTGNDSGDTGNDKDDTEENCPSEAYSDLDVSLWYHEAVDYVLNNGYFYGTSDSIFDPDGTMTRAMFVTVLSRLEGINGSDYTDSVFSDVETGQWYSAAVQWASENGIVEGTGEDAFDPDGNVTREQMAVIMYRYVQYKGIDVTGADSAKYNSFSDTDSVSGWAEEALIWAADQGLINGMGDGTLAPQGTSTRAQVAQIIKNYSDNAA